MGKFYYTAGQYKDLLQQLVIVCTTNEQENKHITEYFDKKKIAYENRALKTGDYCFKINANAETGYLKDTYFTDELFIERKNSLTELAGSIKDQTFHFELKRSIQIKHKFLLIEQSGGWNDIIKHEYRNDYNEKAFWNTLITFQARYNIKIMFIDKSIIGAAIYSICTSILNDYLLKESV
jgi:ERCC4-type nuclease